MILRPVRPEVRQSVRPGRVAAVMEFGFTERQARFLVHVLVFSGVFLERQYRAFTGLGDAVATSSREHPTRVGPRRIRSTPAPILATHTADRLLVWG
jgi:hypothetical protein